MRPGTVFGALLILFGVVALSLGGFSFNRREKVAEVGPVEVTAQRERSVPVSPLVGGLAIAVGVVLIVANSRKGR
jgi:drug/metabolite transporter (DMT)-like permease